MIGATVAIVRWTATVDNRLVALDTRIAEQHHLMATSVQQAAKSAVEAATSAEEARVAALRAAQAAGQSSRVIMEQQGHKVDALKDEMSKQFESLSWRVRMLEEISRRVEEKTK